MSVAIDPCREGYRFDPEPEGLKAQTRANIVVSGIGQAIKIAITLVPLFVLSRVLSPADFGLMALGLVVSEALGVLRECGLSAATIQIRRLTHSQVSALFWINIGLGLFVLLLFLVLGPWIGSWLNQPALYPILLALGVAGAFGSLGIQHEALLQRRMEFKAINIRDIVAQSIGIGSGIAAAFMGMGAWSLVLQNVVTAILATALLWRACKWRPSRPGHFADAKPLISFGGKILVEKVVVQSTKGIDTFALGYFFGTTVTGVYARAQSLVARPIAQALSPIMAVMRPALSRAAEDRERLRRAFLDVFSMIAWLSSFVVVMLVTSAEQIVRIVLGSGWGEVVPIFQALAILAVVEPCHSLLGTAIIAVGRPGLMVKWRVMSSLVIAASVLLSVQQGATAMALTLGITALVLRTPLFFWYGGRHVISDWGALFGALFAPVAAAGAAVAAGFAVTHWFDNEYFARFGGAAAVGALVFALLTLILPPLRRPASSVWSNVKEVGPFRRFRKSG